MSRANQPSDATHISQSPPKKVKGIKRSNDVKLEWVQRKYPQLSEWRSLAAEWMIGETKSVSSRLNALVTFLEKYLINEGLPLDPSIFLARETTLPNFYQTSCPNSKIGLAYNNIINAFLDFVLLLNFSFPDDHGRRLVASTHHNPIPRMSTSGLPKLDESVHSPLPFGYIDELRQMLVEGSNFKDWIWAQSALGAQIGQSGRVAPDWFPVAENDIDLNDQDCVWRRRPLANGLRLEMWSPVRWVALLVKLVLPIRTLQARMLDSGEADTYRYKKGGWELNSNMIAEGSEARPLQQGVFRKNKLISDGKSASAVLYINTNKTADINRAGADKGYVLPWLSGGAVHQDIFLWLEKLRNWQEKYNAITRRTDWSELDGRHIQAKSTIQLQSYPKACFLFRLPEARENERHLPIRESGLDFCWFALLDALTKRLSDRGELHSNGSQIKFLPPEIERTGYPTTLFPLHSLRVSLITALALEGNVPFPILQKLAGHSRLLMTLYYTKPGATHINNILTEAAERLEKNKESSIQNFLLDTEYGHLLDEAIANSRDSLAAAIPHLPSSRNPVGWMPMHHGLCLVGGNTSESTSNSSIGGCYNGGPNVGSPSMPKHSTVPGGSRNCVRCRWFVTEAHYLPSLVAHFNNISYHFDEARNNCLIHEDTLRSLQVRKADAERSKIPFAELALYRNAERVWESGIKRFSDLGEDLVACYRLIDRCRSALDRPSNSSMKLLATGTISDLKIAFEETDSELLQLAGVCKDAEIYPDLEPGKAVLRRSQLLDAALYRENLTPIFMALSEKEQLQAGNAFLKSIASVINPDDAYLGGRTIIKLIDSGENLSLHLGLDLKNLVATNSDRALALDSNELLTWKKYE